MAINFFYVHVTPSTYDVHANVLKTEWNRNNPCRCTHISRVIFKVVNQRIPFVSYCTTPGSQCLCLVDKTKKKFLEKTMKFYTTITRLQYVFDRFERLLRFTYAHTLMVNECDDRPIVVDHTVRAMCNNIKQPLFNADFSWIDTNALRRTWGFLILYATNTLFKNEKSILIIYLHYSQSVSRCAR